MNIWSNYHVVVVWAGSLTLLCFAGGLLLKRTWRAGIITALVGPVILLPMAFAGGLGAMTLGEIVVRGGLNPYGLGAGGGTYVNAIADLFMLFTPFAMLGLYFRYERLFAANAERDHEPIPVGPRIRAEIIENHKLVKIPLRKNSSPKIVKRKFAHHCRNSDGMVRAKFPRRFARHPHPKNRPTHEPDPREV